jgi:hypothetical protein
MRCNVKYPAALAQLGATRSVWAMSRGLLNFGDGSDDQ